MHHENRAPEVDEMSMIGGMVYLALGALASVAYFTVPGMRGNGLVFSLIGLSASAAIVVGAIRNRPRQRLPWMLFAAAQVSFVIGDLLYYAFHFDFPSVGDVFYLAVYPLLVAGLLILIRARSAGRDRGSLLDASVITVGVGLLAWVFLIEPYTQLEGLGGLERLMSIAYPLMDVMLLAVAARLAMGSGSRSPSFYLIGIGILSLLATDSVYGYIELHSGYGQGGLLDAGWLAYYLLWGTAALLPGMRRLDESSPGVRPILTGRRLVPLLGATLIAPAVAIIQSIQDPDTAFSVSSVASAVLFLLVMARMTGLVKSLRLSVDDEHRALFREGVLRRAAVDLGGAPDRDAVEQVTLEAAQALTADASGVDVRVFVGAAHPVAGDGGGLVLAGTSALEVPIATRASNHGSILISGTETLAPPVVAALESLGAQAAVALERAALADDLLRRRSDERMAAIVQQASDVITVLDADLVIRHQTASAGRFLRYEAGILSGRRLLELVHPEDLPVAQAFFVDLAAQPGVRPETEFRFLSGEGSWVNIEALGNNLLGDPRVHGIVVTIRDVTKRKALEEGLRLQVNELTELDRIKSDLVSTVSHELRTPLTTLVGHVEMLNDGDFGELTEDQQWAVQAIDRNSQRLLALIEDMLTLAKIENGGLGLDVRPTDVPELFAEIETTASPLAEAKSIDLGLHITRDMPAVLADRSALERAIMNLLSNAVKFTPEGGSVRLQASHDGTCAAFAVSDTGMGMSAEDKDRLFTRFFRSPTAMSMAIPGTGLGLAIVKKIVDDHGGTIKVESVPGKGTTVEFTIPLVTAAPSRVSALIHRAARAEAAAVVA
jgi:PAS domain S-box-containing protein